MTSARRAQAATEYIILVGLIALGLVAVVSKYFGSTRDGAEAIASNLPGADAAAEDPPVPFELTVPGSMKIRTSSGEAELSFVRRSGDGWERLGPGSVITEDMEFALEVRHPSDPGVPSVDGYIGWAGKSRPSSETTAVRIVDSPSGEHEIGTTVTLRRGDDGVYRSDTLRLRELLSSMR